MLSGIEDIASQLNQISELERQIKQQQRILAELQRLAKPTALAEKFLRRLQDQLAEAVRRHDQFSQSAANSNA